MKFNSYFSRVFVCSGGGASVRRAAVSGCDGGGELSSHSDYQPGGGPAALAGGDAEA